MADENGGALRWRVEAIERKLDKEPDLQVMQQRINDQGTDVSEIKAELKSIRRGLWLAAATFASLAVGVFTLVAQGIR